MDDRPSQTTRAERRLRQRPGSRAAAMRRRQWLLGLGATLIVLALQGVGLLDRQIVEYAALDLRAQWFGRSSLAPSPEIAIVAIDDRAIETVGRWPWDRARLAQAVDELTLAGASVIAMDLLLDSPQAPRYAPGRAGPIDDDGLLGAAIERHGSVVLATNFALDRGRGAPPPPGGAREAGEAGEGAGATRVTMPVLAALLAQRPELLAMPEDEALALLAKELLSESESSADRSAALDDLAVKLGAARALTAKVPVSSAPLPDRTHFWPRSADAKPPIGRVAAGAAGIANVTISGTHDTDGKVRRVPLLVEHQGRLWPMLGLAAVAMHRGVALSELTLGEGAALIPGIADGGAREVPLRRERIRGRTTDGLMFLTWPRAMESWIDQFRPLGAPGDGDGMPEGRCASTLSIGGVLHPVLVAERIEANAAELDRWTRRAIDAELLAMDGYAVAAEGPGTPATGSEAWAARLAALRPLWAQAAEEAAGFLEFVGDEEPEAEEDRARLALLREIAAKFPRILSEIDSGLGSIERQRRVIRSLVAGRICLVGFASTAAPVDVVGTSIHSYTPGVYVHAAVANSLLTGMIRSRVPVWVDLLSIAALGLLGTFVGARGTVLSGPLAVALLVVLWFLVSAVAFWDAAWSIIAFTGPSLAAVGGWLAVMLHRLLVEQRARRRTEERFRSYVSPAVVDILVNNPQLDSMRPQERELTVMFTDLVGFTTIAERLGSERTAEVLAAYLGAMTEVLQSTGATLDKYLGDGVMAFWGAPIADADHAANACRTVLEMMRTLDRLNDTGAFGDGEGLSMRAGLAAGELMVGDFGNPPRNSSYTVIGDAANLAARLESANKQLGTRVLVSQRVYDLAGGEGGGAGEFRWRPVGRLAVKGKVEAEGVYELVGDGDQSPHGERTGEWIALTRRAVEAFARGDFDAALADFDHLEREFGEGRLAGIYRRSAAEWRNLLAGAADGGAEVRFDGTITLTEK